MSIQCEKCGYIGLAVCSNCHKTERSCTCGQWEASCPHCHWVKPPAPDE